MRRSAWLCPVPGVLEEAAFPEVGAQEGLGEEPDGQDGEALGDFGTGPCELAGEDAGGEVDAIRKRREVEGLAERGGHVGQGDDHAGEEHVGQPGELVDGTGALEPEGERRKAILHGETQGEGGVNGGNAQHQ